MSETSQIRRPRELVVSSILQHAFSQFELQYFLSACVPLPSPTAAVARDKRHSKAVLLAALRMQDASYPGSSFIQSPLMKGVGTTTKTMSALSVATETSVVARTKSLSLMPGRYGVFS